jgi:hypothetical protein
MFETLLGQWTVPEVLFCKRMWTELIVDVIQIRNDFICTHADFSDLCFVDAMAEDFIVV